MHELSMTTAILHSAVSYAERTNSSQIKTIILRLGILRDLKKEWIERYFAYVSKGTIAEEAELVVLVSPVVCSCNECGGKFEISLESLANEEIRCSICAAKNYTFISGMEFLIEGIEVI